MKILKNLVMQKNRMVFASLILTFCLTACSQASPSTAEVSNTTEIADTSASLSSSSAGEGAEPSEALQLDHTFRIVTTTFPVYDWVKNIVGEDIADVEVILLNDEGVDYHSFRPDEEDLDLIAKSDVIFCIGGISEEWVYDIEENLTEESSPGSPNDASLQTISQTGEEDNTDENAVVPEFVYLIDELRDHAIKLTPDEENAVEEDGLYGNDIEAFDEHIWLAPLNAYDMCAVITDYLKGLDETHVETYDINAKTYMEALNDLDNTYTEASDAATCTTLIIGDRNPFRYLTETYLLETYTLFDECPLTVTETNDEKRNDIVTLMKNNQYKRVITDADAEDEAYTSITNELTDRAIELIPLHSMHKVSLKEADAGLSYITVMQENLEMLCRIIGYE